MVVSPSIVGYKIIDIIKNGNVVRYFLASDHKLIEESWGDDWDDRPYEHNAGRVYNEYVEKIVDVFYPFDTMVQEPSEDWHYGGNSPFSKWDFKKGKAPRLIISPQSEEEKYFGIIQDYSLLAIDDNTTKIYYGDNITEALEDAVYYMEVPV